MNKLTQHWAEHTSNELAEKIKKGYHTALLPFGATEQHGSHLAVGYDTFIAQRLAVDLAKGKKYLILPALQYGQSDHHIGFSGTLTISEDTLIATILDIARSLELSGITRLILINGHGGNYPLMKKIATNWPFEKIKLSQDADEKMIFKPLAELSKKFSAGALGLHGGLYETSLALHTHPKAVRKGKIKTGLMPKHENWSEVEIKDIVSQGLIHITPSGIIGDPVKASKKLGELFYKKLITHTRQFFK